MKFSYENIFSGLMMLLVFSLAFIYPFINIFRPTNSFYRFYFYFRFHILGIRNFIKKNRVKISLLFCTFGFLFIFDFYIGNFFSQSDGELYKIFRRNLFSLSDGYNF